MLCRHFYSFPFPFSVHQRYYSCIAWTKCGTAIGLTFIKEFTKSFFLKASFNISNYRPRFLSVGQRYSMSTGSSNSGQSRDDTDNDSVDSEDHGPSSYQRNYSTLLALSTQVSNCVTAK